MELSEVPLSRGKGMKNNGKFRDNDESWNLGGEEKKQEGSVTRVMLIHLPSANHPIDFIFVTWISVNHDVLTDVRPPKSLRKKKKKGGGGIFLKTSKHTLQQTFKHVQTNLKV